MEGEALRGERKTFKKKRSGLLTASEDLRWTLTIFEKADRTLISLPVVKFRQRQSNSKIKGVSVLTGFCPAHIKCVKGSKMSINPHA